MGHTVVAVGSGREALDLLADRIFDAIVMDIQMPEMDGLQTTGVIRDYELASGGRRTPIIAMTAYALAGDRERCLAAGMDGYISKPVNPHALREALENIADLFCCEANATTQTAAPSPVLAEMTNASENQLSQSELPVFDRGDLVSRLGGEALVDPFLAKFAASMPGYLDRLRGACPDGERGVAHTIKGMAANIGAVQVSQAAGQLEDELKRGTSDQIAQLKENLIAAYGKFITETGLTVPHLPVS
jgi:CheY-like chemotaxis protein/HPt (histidine-containing phosphotransfer) domain-containing protein